MGDERKVCPVISTGQHYTYCLQGNCHWWDLLNRMCCWKSALEKVTERMAKRREEDAREGT